MTSKRSPKGADNFMLITGISQSIERRLHEAGILTYGKLGSLKPHSVISILGHVDGVTTKRIIKENWLKQARELSSRSAPAGSEVETLSQEGLPSVEGKGVISFIIELSLDEAGRPKRTKAVRVESGIFLDAKIGIIEEWDEWNGRQLLEFIVKRAGLCLPAAKAEMPTAPTAEYRPKARVVPEAIPTHLTIAGPAPSAKSRIAALPHTIEITTSTGGSTFQKSVSIQAPVKATSGIPCANQPFKVQLALDRAEIDSSKGRLNYEASIYAKSLKGRQCHSISAANGRLEPTGTATVIMDASPLPQGLYRLQAVVSLSDSAAQFEPKTTSTLQTGERLMRIA